MKTVLKLLRKELKKWNQTRSEIKSFYYGNKGKEYNDKMVICIRHIQELEGSIKIIKDYMDDKIDFHKEFKHIKLHK